MQLAAKTRLTGVMLEHWYSAALARSATDACKAWRQSRRLRADYSTAGGALSETLLLRVLSMSNPLMNNQ